MTDEELIAVCLAVDDDEEIQQIMKDFECCSADGIDELEREEAACGVSITDTFGPPPEF